MVLDEVSLNKIGLGSTKCLNNNEYTWGLLEFRFPNDTVGLNQAQM